MTRQTPTTRTHALASAPHTAHRHNGGAAQRPPIAGRPTHPKPPPATRGTPPTQTSPPGDTRPATASPASAPLALNPCVRSPARARGDSAGDSGSTDPRAPAPTLPRITASDAPSIYFQATRRTYQRSRAPALPPHGTPAATRHAPPPIAPPRDAPAFPIDGMGEPITTVSDGRAPSADGRSHRGSGLMSTASAHHPQVAEAEAPALAPREPITAVSDGRALSANDTSHQDLALPPTPIEKLMLATTRPPAFRRRLLPRPTTPQ